MISPLYIPVIAAVALLVVVMFVVKSRRSNDGVDSFRRQIDALSPEARRPVVDQVQSAAGRQPDADDDSIEDSTDDEDGARGT